MNNSWNNNCDNFHLKTAMKSEYFFVNFKIQTIIINLDLQRGIQFYNFYSIG